MKQREFYANQELVECTFKPQKMTKDANKKNNTMDNSANSSKRIEKLYQIGIKIVSKKRVGDRDKSEIENEKNQKFCTFKPNLEM